MAVVFVMQINKKRGDMLTIPSESAMAHVKFCDTFVVHLYHNMVVVRISSHEEVFLVPTSPQLFHVQCFLVALGPSIQVCLRMSICICICEYI